MDFRRAAEKQLVLAGSSYSFFSASISLRHHQRFLSYSNSRSSTMAAVSSLMSLCSLVTVAAALSGHHQWHSHRLLILYIEDEKKKSNRIPPALLLSPEGESFKIIDFRVYF